MNTLKAKIIVFFLLTTLLIFTALAVLILKMEREDRTQDLTALLHHVSSEVINDHLDLSQPDADLHYLSRIELIRTLTADKALSNPFFAITRSPDPHARKNTVTVVSVLPGGYYFHIGSDTQIIDKHIGRLAITLYLLFFGALGILTLIFYLVLRKLLEPMEHLARVCATIDLEGEPTRFPVSPRSVEIERLRFALQSLMDKTTFLREKERQMFKETAHQFKTPLAILKARLDRFALDPAADKKIFIRQANQDIAKLLKYLKELLIVHESQFLQNEPRTPVDVAALITDLSTYVTPLLQRKRQSVLFEREGSFVLPTHLDSFKKLLLTVLENCVNHAPENSTITIVVQPDERRIIFGNAVSEERAPALFNSNLGLNIIRELSLSLGIDVTVEKNGEMFFLSLHCGS